MIAAGKLRHRVTIQTPAPVSTSRGLRVTGAYDNVGDTSAQLVQLTGQETDLAHQLCARATHRAFIRYRREFEVTTKQSFLFRGRRFQIGYIANQSEVNAVLECLCVEVKP